MRSTSALLTGAAAILALTALPALAYAQGDRAPAPPATGGGGAPAPAVDRGQPATSPPPTYGGSSGGYTGGGSTSPGRVDGSWRSGGSINPPGRGFSGGTSPGSYSPAPPPSRVELPAPRLDPPGGSPRIGQPIASPPGLMPRDPGPPRVTPPDQVRLEIPGFADRPGGRSGDIGLPEGPRLRAVEILPPQEGGRDGDERVLPPPGDGTVAPPPIDARRPPTPPAPPAPSYPNSPTSPDQGWLLHRLGLWDYFYYYGWRNLGSEFGWWNRGCFVPYLSEEDEYWMRATGRRYPTYAGCGYGYGGYNPYGYGYGYGYGYWQPMGWYGSVYGGYYGYNNGYDYGYGYGYGSYGRSYGFSGNPCAVVNVETYSGRRYRIVAALPQLGTYGPAGLKREMRRQLDQDGSVSVEGHGSQELHLYAGFVKTLSTRWCGDTEW